MKTIGLFFSSMPERLLSLPEYVNDDKAKVSFKDGLLTLTIPKAEKGKCNAININ